MPEPASTRTAVGLALGEVLREGRDRFNALAAEARLLGGGFERDRFTAALCGPIDGLATAAAEVAPAAVQRVVDVAYTAALMLTARGIDLADDSDHPVARLWAGLADGPGLVAADPRRVIGSLTNATLAVAGTPGADPTSFLDRVATTCGRATTAEEWLAAARVAAWACGMAQHRDAAMAAANGLPASLLVIAVTGILSGSLDGWNPEDRWSQPADSEPTPAPEMPQTGHPMGRSAGGFIGLGGPFSALPTITADGHGGLIAIAGPRDGRWRLHADAFGTVLTRAAGDGVAQNAPMPAQRQADDPRKTAHRKGVNVPEDRPITSVAVTDETVAWTTSVSYRIECAPRSRAEAGPVTPRTSAGMPTTGGGAA